MRKKELTRLDNSQYTLQGFLKEFNFFSVVKKRECLKIIDTIRPLALRMAGVVLLVFGLIKIISSFGEERVLLQLDPVVGVALWKLLLAAGLVEVAAGYCLYKSVGPAGGRTAALGGFCLAFSVYRFEIWSSGFHGWCPCLGSVGEWFPWLSNHVTTVSDTAFSLLWAAFLTNLIPALFNSWSQKFGRVGKRGKLGQSVTGLSLFVLLFSALHLNAATETQQQNSHRVGGARIEGNLVMSFYQGGKNVGSYTEPFVVEQKGSEWRINQMASIIQGGFYRKSECSDGTNLISLRVISYVGETNQVSFQKKSADAPVSLTNQLAALTNQLAGSTNQIGKLTPPAKPSKIVVTNRIDINYGSLPALDIFQTRFLWFVLVSTNHSDEEVKSNLCLLKYDQDVPYFLKNYTILPGQEVDSKRMWTLNSDGTIPVGTNEHLHIAGPFPVMDFELATNSTGAVAKATQMTWDVNKNAPKVTWTLAVEVTARTNLMTDANIGFVHPPGAAFVDDYRLLADGHPTRYLSESNLLGLQSFALRDVRMDMLRGMHQLGFSWRTGLAILFALLFPLMLWQLIKKEKQTAQTTQTNQDK